MNVSFRAFQPAFGKSPASEQCRQNIREAYAKSARVAPSEVPFENELAALECYLKARIQYAKEIEDDIKATKEAIADCKIDICNKEADEKCWQELPPITYVSRTKQENELFRLQRVRDRIEVLENRIGSEAEEECDAKQLKQLQQRELEIMRSIVENSHLDIMETECLLEMYL